jgi:hypothetical protein
MAGASLMLLVGITQACSADRPHFRDQADELIFELAVTNPGDAQEVFDFAARHSYRLNLGMKGLGEELIEILEEPGPWYEKLLIAYLLALGEDAQGFEAIIDLVKDSDTKPEVREGLYFCGMKYLGFTERDHASEVKGWDVDLDMWEEALDRIRVNGLNAWRRGLIREIVRSGRPGSGDAAQAAAAWLSYTLEPGDVPFVNDLIGTGSPKCDLALLAMIEKLLMRTFIPEDGENRLDAGLNAFRAWYGERAKEGPDAWLAAAFKNAGYDLDSFYSQPSITKLADALSDDSEIRILVRGQALGALNRICGLHVDRRIIFMEKEEREKAAAAYRKWYMDLANRLLVE